MVDNMKELSEQYSDSGNLKSRIQIHELYSVNKQDWHSWLFEQMQLNTNKKVLELGCGNGVFWYKNKHRFPKGMHVTLSDNFAGMLSDTRKNLVDFDDFKYKQIDIQAIPSEVGSFDVIIANHMLYHVSDRQRALSEVRRILNDEGVFYCSTIGKSHLIEFGELLNDFDPQLNYVSAYTNSNKFGLENGEVQLSEYFSKVNLKIYPDGLKITNVNSIVDYIASSNTYIQNILTGKKLSDFIAYLEERKIQNGGFIKVTKSSGLFECS